MDSPTLPPIEECLERSLGAPEILAGALASRLETVAALSPDSVKAISEEIKLRAFRFLLPAFTVKLAAARQELFGNRDRYATASPTEIGEQIAASVLTASDARLEEMADTVMSLRAQAIELGIRRFAEHVETLVSSSGSASVISALTFPQSDSHNGGKQVIVFQSGQNKRIVYKPVSSFPLSVFNAVLKHIIFELVGETPSAVNVLVDGGNYAFLSFVDADNAVSGKNDPGQYYYRSGIMMSVAHAMQVTDLHFENILPCDGFPVAIDVETLAVSDGREPFNVASTQLVSEYGLSGITGGGDIREYGIFGTGTIGNGVVQFWRNTWRAPNRLSDEHTGQMIDPMNYRDAIIGGFADGYNGILRCRDALQTLITHSAGAAGHGRIRVIVRPTSFYASLLSRIAQPVYGTAAELTGDIRERLQDGPSLLGDEVSAALIGCELYDLQRGDIPYFWTRMNSRAMFHENWGKLEDICDQTPYDRLIQRLRELNGEDRDTQIHLLDKMLC